MRLPRGTCSGAASSDKHRGPSRSLRSGREARRGVDTADVETGTTEGALRRCCRRRSGVGALWTAPGGGGPATAPPVQAVDGTSSVACPVVSATTSAL
mmetsp:Transcript_88867/g.231651  ORF Transcript_88867/g.231651 Transcript_88867/m.231651 type:complete len:98 (+) Transcript_88867:218-511(+)